MLPHFAEPKSMMLDEPENGNEKIRFFD